MDILDLQLQWHWVWVLHMGISYTGMVLQREMWTGKRQRWITTTVWFMTDTIITLQMKLVS